MPMYVPLYAMNCFSLAAFNILFENLCLSAGWVWDNLGLIHFLFIIIGVIPPFWICRWMLVHRVWNIFSHYFYKTLSLYSHILGLLLYFILEFLALSCWSLRICCIFLSSLLFWIEYVYLSTGSLKFAVELRYVMKFLSRILYFHLFGLL